MTGSASSAGPGAARARRIPPAAAVAAVLAAAAAVAAGAVLLAGVARAPRPPAPVRVAGYRLEPAGGRAQRVSLEVAADPAARARGLMGRRALPRGTGMVFLFPGDVDAAFWMKDTLVPLSLAFVAADGRVVSVAELRPCAADPCPLTRPAGPYRYAVELPAGALRAAGIGPGDRVVAEDPAALPTPS